MIIWTRIHDNLCQRYSKVARKLEQFEKEHSSRKLLASLLRHSWLIVDISWAVLLWEQLKENFISFESQIRIHQLQNALIESLNHLNYIFQVFTTKKAKMEKLLEKFKEGKLQFLFASFILILSLGLFSSSSLVSSRRSYQSRPIRRMLWYARSWN